MKTLLNKPGLGLAIVLTVLIASLITDALHLWSEPAFPKQRLNRSIWAEGLIETIPHRGLWSTQLQFRIKKLNGYRPSLNLPIRLYWSHPTRRLKPGQRWRLPLHLKRIHGHRNPGIINPAIYAALRGVKIQGRVRSHHQPVFLGQTWHYFLARWRQHLSEQLQKRWSKSFKQRGLLLALSVGVRHDVTQEQWKVLRATGTTHLMAISGLHVGLVALLVGCFVSGLVRLFPPLLRRRPAQEWGGVAAACAAIAYALLAGMSLSTQRALIMILIYLYFRYRRRVVSSWRVLLATWCIVVAFSPESLWMPGFWLSFVAVFWLFYRAEVYPQSKNRWDFLSMQWRLSLAMLPWTLYWFGQVGLYGMAANLVAVPVVTWAVVPLLLLGIVLLPVQAQWGAAPLHWAALCFSNLWKLLEYIAAWPQSLWFHSLPQFTLLLCAFISLLWLLAPSGWTSRYLGVLGCLPLIFTRYDRPGAGELWVTLLDVGQGLSVVLETQKHVLVYDTGPGWLPGLDAGARIILPFLRYRGLQKIDTVVISHGDLDHRGGLNSLRSAMPIQKLLTSDRRRVKGGAPCYAGQHWQWDGVKFSMLAPWRGEKHHGNDGSCVLRVQAGKQAVLLPGDISWRAEEKLVQRSRNQLAADLLIAPHHGSKTSSSMDFLSAVKPHHVWFATGYQNRFHFPRPETVARYRAVGSKMANTATSGALLLKLNNRNGR